MNKNKINKEPRNLRIAHDRGVSLSDWLDVFNLFFYPTSYFLHIVDSEQPLIVIKKIPCPRLEIVREFQACATTSGQIDNIDFYKTVDGAICRVKDLSTFLIDNIKLENIFFIWGKPLEIVFSRDLYSPKISRINDLIFDNAGYPKDYMRNQKSARGEKGYSDILAIIVYECCDSKCVKPCFRYNQEKSSKNRYRKNIFRRQLKDFCPLDNIHNQLINSFHLT